MGSAAGINCKLNARMYVQVLPSTTKGERGALSPGAGHLLVAWEPLACGHCSAAWPVHPRRDRAGGGQTPLP